MESPHFGSLNREQLDELKTKMGREDANDMEAVQYANWSQVLKSDVSSYKLSMFIDKRNEKIILDIANPSLKKESDMMDSLRAEIRFMTELKKILNSANNKKAYASEGIKKLEAKAK